MNKDEIIQILKENKKVMTDQYGIIQIGIFGSYVHSLQNEGSDIDIAIEMTKEKKNLHNFLALKRFLEQQLGRNVDLGFKHSLKPTISNYIEATIIYV